MSILALDYGRKKIGLALSRANFLSACYKTVLNNQSTISELKKIRDRENIELIVFGVPKGLNNKTGTLENEAKKFAEKLEIELDLPLIYIDESFSSEEAMHNLKNLGYSLAKSKILVDQEAARIILEEYLNSKQ